MSQSPCGMEGKGCEAPDGAWVRPGDNKGSGKSMRDYLKEESWNLSIEEERRLANSRSGTIRDTPLIQWERHENIRKIRKASI